MDSQVPFPGVNSSGTGIDIQRALDILSLRSQQPNPSLVAATSTTLAPHHVSEEHHDDHSHHRDHNVHSIGCHSHIPQGGIEMGQQIDLSDQTKAIVDSIEEQRQALNEERRKRIIEIKSQLETMTVKDLLVSVLDAQVGRVQAYREYDDGLETVLKTANFSAYPTVCAKATAFFSVLSETISAIQTILKDKHERRDLSEVIVELQSREREKLNLTAALHLERIRALNLKCGETTSKTEDDNTDDRVMRLLLEGITSIRGRLVTCVEEINDILEELRYDIFVED